MKKVLKVIVVDKAYGTEFGLPEYTTEGSAGMDLRVVTHSTITIKPGETALLPTGLKIFIDDPSLAGIVLPRSGLGHRDGIILGNTVGLIDSDYQGQLMLSVWNRSDKPFVINHGDRLAQYVLVPVVQAVLEVVESFTETDRGEGGWGHSGKE